MIDWKKWWPEREGKNQKRHMVTVAASRVSGHANLFDSEHKHQAFIALRISTAERERNLSRDWIYSDKEICEVYMSQAQWATMISSLSSGSGIPATLQHILQERVEQPPEPEARVDLFSGEMAKTLSGVIGRIDEMAKGRLTKAQLSELAMMKQDIKSNLPFVASQFDEHMENRVERAKADVEAHMNNAISRVGLAAIAQSENLVRMLETSNEPHDEGQDPKGGE